MTSLTTAKETGRGAGIPAPRGGQSVRLLVLGVDEDARLLRERAAAAGYELAQRYSARVSHVAYGSGVDPEDGRYAKIRDAGLVLQPIGTCATQLGLAAAGPVITASEDEADAADPESDDFYEDDELDEPGGPDPLAYPPLPEEEPIAALVPVPGEDAGLFDVPDDVPDDAAAVALAGAVVGVDPWPGADDAAARDDDGAGEPALALDYELSVYEVQAFEVFESFGEETLGDAALVDEMLAFGAPALEMPAFAAPGDEVPGDEAPGDEAPGDEFPVRGVSVDAVPRADGADSPQIHPHPHPHPHSHARRGGPRLLVLSFAWAMVPLISLGLLTPVAFGYAAVRTRSRLFAAATLGYALAVVLAFALSATHPQAGSTANGTGGLLTFALAVAWLGGTGHALSARAKVFGA